MKGCADFQRYQSVPGTSVWKQGEDGSRDRDLLLRELNRDLRLWDVLVDPARKIRIGNKLYFGDDDLLVAEVIDNTTSRGRTLRFLFDGDYDEFKRPCIRWVKLRCPVGFVRKWSRLMRSVIRPFLPNTKGRSQPRRQVSILAST